MTLSRSGRPSVSLNGRCKHLFVLTQIPRVRFAARETGAVDSGLLSRANADCLPVECVANRVRLRVFERDEARSAGRGARISGRSLFSVTMFCRRARLSILKVVSALFKGYAEDLLALWSLRERNPGRSSLCCSCPCAWFAGSRAPRRSYPGAMMPSETSRVISCAVATSHDIGEGDPVAEGAHSVRAACPWHRRRRAESRQVPPHRRRNRLF